ncbi:MAG: permease, partial [Mycobacteriaceae bacterium]|nr:permease [Mycobacteriaceae bacterium]
MTVAAPTDRRRVDSLHVLVAGLITFALVGGTLRTFVTGHADLATAGTVFCGVFIQALPFLTLGVVVSGLIAAFV